MAYKNVTVPVDGARISIKDGELKVPDNPIIPFVEGDGTGRDIWRASIRVFDSAVEKAYGGKRKIRWMEVYSGEKAYQMYQNWLPDETVEAFKEFLVGIKGPLTTPIGGGIRSLNVALRQLLDLYVCLRPVRYYKGVPSPMNNPQDVDVVIFRENTEDLYTGLEFQQGTPQSEKLVELLKENFTSQYTKIRFPETAGLGIKPISVEGTERHVRASIQWALVNKRKSVTFVHNCERMAFTEGAFLNWGYALAKREFRNQIVTERETQILKNRESHPEITVEDHARMIYPDYDLLSPKEQEDVRQEVKETLKLQPSHGSGQWKSMLLVKDCLTRIAMSTVVVRPQEFDVICTMNLNGDYISDQIAAMVGGIGIAPGANINYATGHAIFEATHGTAPKYTDLDKVNPGSVILSGEMMLRYMGWVEAADLIVKGMEGAIMAKTVTYDFERLMEGATLVKTSEFGNEIIKHMGK